jgi:hypothetical protein
VSSSGTLTGIMRNADEGLLDGLALRMTLGMEYGTLKGICDGSTLGCALGVELGVLDGEYVGLSL